jgi:hypothetical protein
MSTSLSDEPDLTFIKDASTRREACEKRNSLKSSTGLSTLSEEQIAMQNYWTNILVAWCNVGPEDSEASDTSIVIPTTGVTEEWINTQKTILEGKGYKVVVSGSSFKVTF